MGLSATTNAAEEDWAKILQELNARGWSLYKISKHLGGIRVEVVKNWYRIEPRYSHAIHLLELHRTVTTSSTVHLIER